MCACLYDPDGRLTAGFVQRELRHFPVDRGPSTLQESVHRPDLIEWAKAIVERLPWRGVIEVEFMEDPRDGVPKFMEINPRFWNSLYTSVMSGVDFPWLLYRMSCGEIVEPVFDYRPGVRCRSLLPGDILHYAANKDRLRLDPGFWSGPQSGGIDDVMSWRDPLPTAGLLLSCLRYLPNPKMWSMLFKRA